MVSETRSQLEPIFNPRHIAFIGASNNAGKWGHHIINSVIRTGFDGGIYPVNSKEREVMGLPAYPNLTAIPVPVDLAVIAIPANQIPAVLKECARKRVQHAIIVSGGFADKGVLGRRLQNEINSIAKTSGIKIVGPNSLGVLNRTGKFSTVGVLKELNEGGISIASQSGILAVSLIQLAMARGYGISKMVNTGNQANISFADYLEYLAEDLTTQAIVLYVEEITEGGRFYRVAREVSKKKPILVLKGGKSAAGARAALGHTGSLAGSDEVFDALCQQAGLIRCYELDHCLEMAAALATQPLPRDNRIAIILGFGGQCVTTADACVAHGLVLPEFDRSLQRFIQKSLLTHAPSPRNPVDTVLGPFLPPSVVLETIAGLNYIDGLIVNAPSTLGLGQVVLVADKERESASMAQAKTLVSLFRQFGKPVIALHSSYAFHKESDDILRSAGIPVYDTGAQCARAMSGLVRYSQTRRKED